MSDIPVDQWLRDNNLRDIVKGRSPVHLPDGTRHPYGVYIGPIRVSETMIILWEDGRTKAVHAEWNDLDDPQRRAEVEAWKSQLTTLSTAPSDALESLLREASDADSPSAGDEPFPLPQAHIKNVEYIFANYPGYDPLCMRVTLQTGSTISVAFISRNLTTQKLEVISRPTKGGRESKFLLRSAGVHPIRLTNDVRLIGNDSITVRLPKQVKALQGLRNQWAIWSCLAALMNVANRLGYRSFNPYSLDVQFVPTKNAHFGDVDGVPTLIFCETTDLFTDPTVIYHELGHALWSMLFISPPKSIGVPRRWSEDVYYEGLQEGFADWLAATMTNRMQVVPSVVDGGRLIGAAEANGQWEGPDTPDHKYVVGHAWANLLWDLAKRIGHKSTAMALILYAHFRPFPSAESVHQPTPHPIRCYVNAIRNVADYFASPQGPELYRKPAVYKAERVQAVDWNALIATHRIPD